MHEFVTTGQAIMRKLISRIFPMKYDALEGSEKLMSLSQKHMNRKRLIDRCYAGSFTLNPLLMRCVRKLESLVDKSMESVGGQRLAMPSLSPSDLWKKTGRWSSMGKELMRITDRNNHEFCLAPTHEETICSLVSSYNKLSYKNLPLLLYQISNKFRDEPHPKHGLLRGREFLMKDMYTFDTDEHSAMQTYESVIEAYEKLFHHLGLDVIKVSADTGLIGGTISHEFHVATEVGEDLLNVCSRCKSAYNAELPQAPNKSCQNSNDHGGSKCTYTTVKGIELGHAFLLGTRYSEPLKVMYTDSQGRYQLCYMGCFGIGVTRLIAAAVEVLSTENHIKFPKRIAPYTAVIIPQRRGHRSDDTYSIAERLYDRLDGADGSSLSGDIVMDDRINLSIGNRLRQAKEMGYPYALCVGNNALEDPGLIEVKDLYKEETTMIPIDSVLEHMNLLIRYLSLALTFLVFSDLLLNLTTTKVWFRQMSFTVSLKLPFNIQD